MSRSTVQGYDFQDVAEYVAKQVKKQGKDRVFFAVFYDPLSKLPESKQPKEGEKVDWKTEWNKRQKQGKENPASSFASKPKISSPG